MSTNDENSICLACGALVLADLAESHDAWHTRIANVAIEQGRQIELLTRQIRALTPGEWPA